ncbi:TetR/AcrR family transcriptional regulator [Intrasporangium flavum]|uniref:TetR/AcrR family transcriptional regulator n=1 Tax=Intrasporangium flavum TaxID=1428657 RepID=UPI00096BECE3|nr:TetR/AcrR family transcriptional regulator [Intrasporangium flavum]
MTDAPHAATPPAPDPGSQPSRAPGRDRLLEAASRLFYREGINGVGVDRILAEAGVTRATMYRHFTGKEALVAAYLQSEDATIRGYFTAAESGGRTARELLERVVDAVADDVSRYHTRGCPFINAAAEFPDAASPVRHIVTAHRTWFRQTLTDLARAAGSPDPEAMAAALVLLRDAALVGGYLDGVDVTAPAFVTTARGVAGLDAAD